MKESSKIASFDKAKAAKFFRSFRIYGFLWTYVKTMGRFRPKYAVRLPIAIPRRKKHVGIIGCGQFSFAAIGFFLRKNQGAVIKKCYDIDSKNGLSFARYYNALFVKKSEEIIEDPDISLVYIASNHASHTAYALAALKQGKEVYIEKPVSTSYDQFKQLNNEISNTNAKVYVGYNRPFSPAIKTVVEHLPDKRSPITLSCFITGHQIPKEHWYRNPEEGTRVCGNMGHWIDLAIHLFHYYKVPNIYNVHIAYSDENENDDNFTVVLTTEFSDLVTITLSARQEPFEGINETINIQTGDLIAKIDDFRRLDLWKGAKYRKWKFFRKNIGHEKTILQPFNGTGRNWVEMEKSSKIMLFIAEMVKVRKESATLNLDNL
ncbi:MAG: Gfo/Idh/MocA family oxidoreductase [Bacteroidota bacterium]